MPAIEFQTFAVLTTGAAMTLMGFLGLFGIPLAQAILNGALLVGTAVLSFYAGASGTR